MAARHRNVVEVEFSLALNSRTGRFFLAREMMGGVSDLIGSIRYWRTTASCVPGGLYGRVLGRLTADECRTRLTSPWLDSLIPRVRRPVPVVFTDPFQVLMYKLKPHDVVICHDMGPVTHPELYGAGTERAYKKLFSEVRSVCPHIAFVSRSSKREYENLYGQAYNSGRVLYPGIRFEVGDGPIEPVPGVRKPFLLTVGSVGTRKNQARSIQAFKVTGLASKGYSYVIAGGRESGHEAARSLAASTPCVQMTGYVSEKQLRWLYATADGFVLPSLLEGFGLPAAEAVDRGLIPVVSRGGALHEVTGDSAILVNPLDVNSIATGMLELTSLPNELRAARLSALRAHISQFTREASTRCWRSILETAIAGCA